MNYRDLLDYGFYEDNFTYTVVLDKNKLGIYNIDLNKEEEKIKSFFNADNIEINRG